MGKGKARGVIPCPVCMIQWTKSLVEGASTPVEGHQNGSCHLSLIFRDESDFAWWGREGGKHITRRRNSVSQKVGRHGVAPEEGRGMCLGHRVNVATGPQQGIYPCCPQSRRVPELSMPAQERGSNRVSWPDSCPHSLPPPFHQHALCFS